MFYLDLTSLPYVFALSSTKSQFTCTQRKPRIRRQEEYLSSLANRRRLLNDSRDIIRAAMEILTPAQLAERLHVKPSWVYEQTRKRTGVRNPDSFPYIKMGLYLRFDWNDVLAWLERQKRGGSE